MSQNVTYWIMAIFFAILLCSWRVSKLTEELRAIHETMKQQSTNSKP